MAIKLFGIKESAFDGKAEAARQMQQININKMLSDLKDHIAINIALPVKQKSGYDGSSTHLTKIPRQYVRSR